MLFSEERTEEILAIDEARTRFQVRDAPFGEIGDYRFFEVSLWGRPPKPSHFRRPRQDAGGMPLKGGFSRK